MKAMIFGLRSGRALLVGLVMIALSHVAWPAWGDVALVERSVVPKGVWVRSIDAPSACFSPGVPLTFEIKVFKGRQFASPRIVHAQPLAYYSKRPVGPAVAGMFENDNARITLPDSLPKGPYRLAVTFFDDQGKQVAKGMSNFAVMAGPPPMPTNPDDEWLGTCAHFQWTAPNPLIDQQLNAAKLIGINWFRMNLPPVHDQSLPMFKQKTNKAKYILDRAAQRGMNFYILALGGDVSERAVPDWNEGRFAWSYPPKDWDALADAITHQMNTFGRQVRYWELHNEPHGNFLRIEGLEEKYPGSKDQVVQKFFEYGRKAQQAAEHDVQIVGPASNSWCYDATERMLAENGRFVDVVSAHYNEAPLQVRNGTARLQRAIDRHLDEPADIWITESNAMNGVWGQSDLNFKYRHYLRTWFEGLVDRAYPYVFNHARSRDLWRAPMIDPKYNTPQPGVFLMQAMYRHTRNAQRLGRVFVDDAIESYLSMRDDGTMQMVAWRTRDAQGAVQLPAEILAADSKAYDLYWNALPTEDVELTREPVFIENVNWEDPAVRAALVQITPGIYRLDPDVNNRMTLVIANPSDQARTYAVRFDDPDINVSADSVEVSAGTVEQSVAARSSVQIPIIVTRTGGEDGVHPLTAQINGEPRQLARFYFHTPDDVETISLLTQVEPESWRVYPHFQAPDSLGEPRGSFEKQLDTIEAMPDTGKRLQGLPQTPWQGEYREDWRGLPEDAGIMQQVRWVQSKEAQGSKLVEFWVDYPADRSIKWYDASFGLSNRIEIPGIPVKARVRVRALPGMMDGNKVFGLGFRDGNGDLVRFFFENPIVPSAEFREYETTIDSIYGEEKRKAAFGGIKWGLSPRYPLAFEGVGMVSEGPVMNFKDGRWRGGIQVESIEIDYHPIASDQMPESVETPLIAY